MGLATTRKTISIVLAVIIALSMSVLLPSLVLSYTAASETFIEKFFVNGEIEAQCTAELDAAYKTLEAESGIPSRVFEQVKEDYSVSSSLKTAVDNAFGAEYSTLYNNNLVTYFYNLSLEYLQGNKIEYDEAQVRNAADKAAKIFSDAVGLHGIDTVKVKADAIKNGAVGASTVAAFLMVLCIIMIVFMYNDTRKGVIYAAAGAAGGALGTLLGSLLCALIRVGKDVRVSPAVYQAAINHLLQANYLLTAALSLAVMLLAYAILLILMKRLNKKSVRRIVV